MNRRTEDVKRDRVLDKIGVSFRAGRSEGDIETTGRGREIPEIGELEHPGGAVKSQSGRHALGEYTRVELPERLREMF